MYFPAASTPKQKPLTELALASSEGAFCVIKPAQRLSFSGCPLAEVNPIYRSYTHYDEKVERGKA